MSSAMAACSACGHVFGESDALDPCPRCGSTERTLRRQELDVDRTDPNQPTRVR
jgi:rRNA maturation endonuclease Nob1